jgi:hypothetical protein
MTDVTDEQRLRSTFIDIADAAVIDPETDRRAAWHALRRRAHRRRHRRIGTTVVVLALAIAAVSVVPLLDRVDHDSGRLVKTVRPTPTPGPLSVLRRIGGVWAPDPIAYDGHDIWLARKVADQASGAAVVVEHRDGSSGALLGSIRVGQEAVFGIAVDRAGSVWIAGGGDGGVPSTTVTRIDARTERIVFTHTLTTTGCSCRIAAGAGGAWLSANGENRVLRLDARTGEVAASIPLPTLSFSLAVVGDRVQVGLDDSRIAVIDPARNRVERIIDVGTPRPGTGSVDRPFIVGITPAGSGAGGNADSWATRGDGEVFSIVDEQRVAGRPATLLRSVAGATVMGDTLWGAGDDQLVFHRVGGGDGFANYDLDRASFGPVIPRRRPFVVSNESNQPALGAVVAAGATLWIVDRGLRILVVQT